MSSGGQDYYIERGGFSIIKRSGRAELEVAVRVRITDSIGYEWLTRNTPIEDVKWFHFAMTWKLEVGMKVFINGEEHIANPPTTRQQFDPDDNRRLPATLVLARLSNSGGFPGSCQFDDTQIWNRVKTEEEIEHIHQGINIYVDKCYMKIVDTK